MNEDYFLVSSSFIIMNGDNSVTANAFLANNDDILELTEDFDIQVQHMTSGDYFIFGCPITINILDNENTGKYPYRLGARVIFTPYCHAHMVVGHHR